MAKFKPIILLGAEADFNNTFLIFKQNKKSRHNACSH
jgi:hypothetical protein